MEASGAVLRRAPAISGFRIQQGDATDPFFSGMRSSFRISARPRGLSAGGFSDEGHLKYYLSPARCGARKKEEKRRAKLVKGLVRDLSAFYSMGFGVEVEDGLAGEVKGKMISEAAELLLGQLKQLRAQEKEKKRKRKEEKAAKKATKVKDCADENASSSSSESSDSECESAVKMSSLGTVAIAELKDLIIPTVAPNCNSAPLLLELSKTGEDMEENNYALKLGPECSNTSATTSSSDSCGCCSNSIPVVDRPMDKIEVCMGGKCKKSGALQLLEEFESKMGIEGAVVGCKCMGKCRDGPNVRVVGRRTEEDNVKDVKNPLCIGVGLDDVGTIVARFFGEKGVGLVTP
ncbi:diacylglycerol O-acyltransferase 3 [Elaeis guineensis]|uniref:Diacylglycerol O-acyltransferase 3 n=1 Tax=Elaeis guineensis var. tenera TaxID=51953 RepID=A0A6I9QG69_ELAGV|nr:diacylglycerol O-acyltransferase 3 [Elaeis guineensis]